MNQIAILEPREQPLTVDDYKKIEMQIEKNFRVKSLRYSKSMPKVDNHGDIYGWESESFETGIEFILTGAPSPKLIDAMTRPATSKHIAYHLTRLSAHKHNAQGGFRFQVIIEDACRDLEGASEWAVCKAYDKLRYADGNFFPSVKEIVDAVRWFDTAAQKIRAPAETSHQIEAEYDPKVEKTPEGKARVAEALHNARIPHDKEFCAQCNPKPGDIPF